MKMLDVLEIGSLNEFVRKELASQHKIPELCASVINGLDVKVECISNKCRTLDQSCLRCFLL